MRFPNRAPWKWSKFFDGRRGSVLRRIALVLTVGGGLFWLCFEIAIRSVPLPAELFRPVEATTTVRDVHGAPVAFLPTRQARICEPVALAAMGRWLPLLTVALEDHRFYRHAGTDWYATSAAVWRNLRAGRIVSGGSTIAQQLIKASLHRGRRVWWAKFYEPLAAIRLYRLWGKERILQEYLNRADYGNRQRGPVAAARMYFKKAPDKLTFPEALYLAGLPQAPTAFNPLRHAQAADAKYRRSLARAATLGLLSTEEQAIFAAPPALSYDPPPPRLAPHFVDALLAAQRGLPGGTVETTLDLDLQRFVEQQVQIHLDRLAGQEVTEAAVVILDARTGAVCAMVGSKDYAARDGGQTNGTLDFRSCGSTLKPFLYLRAIDQRLVTAATLLPDTPDAIRTEYTDYDPANYDKRYWGPVRVREALANSLNVPAVVTLSRVGARPMFHALEDFGFKFSRGFDEYGAGMILGNAEIRLVDLTSAFTVFAGSALAAEPRFLKSAPERHHSFASTEAVAIVGDILSDNEARLKTFGAFSPLAFDQARVPCKTGTSAGFRDAWTVGVTKEHAVGVWVGNFNGQPMREVAAITGAAPLWHDLVAHLLRSGDHSVPLAAVGGGLIKAEVCKVTGLLPGAATKDTVAEWFIAGTQPAATADQYFRPGPRGVRLVLPPEYSLWCQGGRNYLGALVADDGPLRIICPRPNATFLIDDTLPRSQQAISLVATRPQTSWYVDGQLISPLDGQVLWPLRVGDHRVRAISNDSSSEQTFTVAGDTPDPRQIGEPRNVALEINLTEQVASVRINGVPVRTFPVSSGRTDHPTPDGNFKVVRKAEVHFSSLYGHLVDADGQVLDSDANGFAPLSQGQRFVPSPMRYFIEFDRGNGLHAGPLPGYPASHGCVRLLPADAAFCYEHLELEDPIRITGRAPVGKEGTSQNSLARAWRVRGD